MKKYHTLNVKIGAFFVVLVVLVAVFLGTLIYRINYSDAESFCKRQLLKCGEYLGDSIDFEKLEKEYTKRVEGIFAKDYNQYMQELEEFQKIFDLSYVFIYKPCIDENGHYANDVEFLFDLNPPGDTKDKQYAYGEHKTGIREYQEISDVIETGEAQTSTVFENTNDGNLLTAFVPITKLEDKNDKSELIIVGISNSMDQVQEIAMRSSFLMIFSVELVIVAFAVILLFYLRRKVINPVKLLSKRMDTFVSSGHKLDSAYVTEINTHDEIEQMADNFNNMADSIRKYTDDLKSITSAQERLRAELDVAGSIRAAISSETAYPAFTERSDFELYASLKNTVYNSCSFCNYFLADQDHLIIVIGESVGKNLPSMLMSMLAATGISAFSRMHAEPYKAAYEANNSLCSFERNDMSMTVSALIAEIDLATGLMKYVNAGMPPILIKRTGESYIREEKSMQFNLGEMHGVTFEQKTLQLNQGMTLFFNSYGIPEMKNKLGESFTEERLADEINDIASSNYPLNEMIDELENRLELFRDGAASVLDTTILGFRYLG